MHFCLQLEYLSLTIFMSKIIKLWYLECFIKFKCWMKNDWLYYFTPVQNRNLSNWNQGLHQKESCHKSIYSKPQLCNFRITSCTQICLFILFSFSFPMEWINFNAFQFARFVFSTWNLLTPSKVEVSCAPFITCFDWRHKTSNWF